MSTNLSATEQIWRAVTKASFGVISYATPGGEPRSSGVIYTVVGRRLYVAVAVDSWKAKHIAESGRVAMTVPIRRGGAMSLIFPIPPATVSFHGRAVVHEPNSPLTREALTALGRLLPPDRRTANRIIEITPVGRFVTYGVGVSLMAMRDPATALARVPVQSTNVDSQV